jgi:DNA polymerase elongation subunit (family B)
MSSVTYAYIFDITGSPRPDAVLLIGKIGDCNESTTIAVQGVAIEWTFMGLDSSSIDFFTSTCTAISKLFREYESITVLPSYPKSVTYDLVVPESMSTRTNDGIVIRFTCSSWKALRELQTHVTTGAHPWKRVHNAKQSTVERFILERSLRGPSWVGAKHLRPTSTTDFGSLTTKTHFMVPHPEHISVHDVHPTKKPVRFVMAAFHATWEHTEPVMCTICIWTCVNIESTQLQEEYQQTFHFMKRGADIVQEQSKNVWYIRDKADLLSKVAMLLHKKDVDILLFGDMKAETSHLRDDLHIFERRTGGKTSEYFNYSSHGRLLVDIHDMAQTVLVDPLSDYSIESLIAKAGLDLKENNEEGQHAPFKPLLTLNREARIPLQVARLCMHWQFLMLARNVANICGTTWQQALRGTQRVRIDMLFQHALYQRNLLYPEKKAYETYTVDGVVQPRRKMKSAPQFEGGKQWTPKPGLYNTIVLLLDYNSMYPNIIREFNLCFTGRGILPQLIGTMIEERAQLQAQCNALNPSDPAVASLQIRIRAVKIVSNAIFGVFAFENFRFHCVELARRIAEYGRECIAFSAEALPPNSLISGHTDSLMMDTGTTDPEVVQQLETQLLRTINSRHKYLRMSVRGRYRYTIIIQKSNYMYLTMPPESVVGYIGGHALASSACTWIRKWYQTIVECIFNSLPEYAWTTTDQLVQHIYRLVDKASTTQLEEPNEALVSWVRINQVMYSSPETQPHVQIVKRLNLSSNVGQSVPMIYSTQPHAGSEHRASYAYHPSELGESTPIDYVHYCHELFNSIEKMLLLIPGIDMDRVAKSMGIAHTSASKRSNVSNALPKIEFEPAFLDLAHCTPYVLLSNRYSMWETNTLAFPCSNGCNQTHAFRGVHDPDCLTCIHCKKPIYNALPISEWKSYIDRACTCILECIDAPDEKLYCALFWQSRCYWKHADNLPPLTILFLIYLQEWWLERQRGLAAPF